MSSLKEMAPGWSPEAINEETQTQGEGQHSTPDPEALIAAFAAKWPRCFFVEEEKRRPLQLKIHFQIFGEYAWDDRDAIRAALRRYVCALRYLHALDVGAERIGLNGDPAGEVSEEEAYGAKRRLKSHYDYEAELERQRRRLHPANAEKPRLSLGRRA